MTREERLWQAFLASLPEAQRYEHTRWGSEASHRDAAEEALRMAKQALVIWEEEPHE